MKVSEEQFNHMRYLLANRLFADQSGMNTINLYGRQQLFNRCLNEAESYIRTMNILPEVTA